MQPVVFKLPFKHHDVSPTPGTKKIPLLVRTLCQVASRLVMEQLERFLTRTSFRFIVSSTTKWR